MSTPVQTASFEEPRPQLAQWMRRQYSLSAQKMMSAISATGLVKERRGFGRVIRPAKGSILASPAIAAYDPDPDYFFHWLRDSAVIIDALRILISSGEIAQVAGLAHFKDFLRFSLKLSALDGPAFLAAAGDFRAKVDPFFLQYVRPDSELSSLSGDAVLGEPRFDPDGSIDILKWSRPQHDGPALRALSVMRFCSTAAATDASALQLASELLPRDLDFTLKHWREPSFDIWEEEQGRHYYTQLVQCEALAGGAKWFEEADEAERGRACRAAAQQIDAGLDDFWSESDGFYKSRIGGSGEKELDIAALLAVVHAGREHGAHSVADPRAHATARRLEELFAGLYKINQPLPHDRAAAMGRYRGDAYYSGGAYYFSTLGAAEFHYRAARAAGDGLLHDGHPGLSFDEALRRGDMFMATVAAYTPQGGDLSEQFDQTSGAQTSAKNLAWSHAAFISACASRDAAFETSAGADG